MTNVARETRTTARTARPVAKRKSFSGLSREAKILIKVVASVLAVIFVLVGLQAYTATLQYNNNSISSDNAYLQAEIDSLKSQIIDETKVTSIEKTATEKYGMVYPTADNCIAIKEDSEVKTDNLAVRIKKRAYND